MSGWVRVAVIAAVTWGVLSALGVAVLVVLWAVGRSVRGEVAAVEPEQDTRGEEYLEWLEARYWNSHTTPD